MLHQIRTRGGVDVEYEQHPLDYKNAIDPLVDRLNAQRGALFASSFEYPGRYTCWDIGFCNPPLVLESIHNAVILEALNPRGEVLISILHQVLMKSDELEVSDYADKTFSITVKPSSRIFIEEERSKQPSVFSIIRLILDFFYCPQEPYLGLYGAFGYDLIYQFEALSLKQLRSPNQRDMVLYLPDEIYIVNHRKEEAFIRRYDFQFQGKATQSLPREGEFQDYNPTLKPKEESDHEPGEYASLVALAKERFACGDLFEVVLSQTFFEHCNEKPSSVFQRLRSLNPSPYGFFINNGKEEYLIGASPEMYVRLQGNEVETCPISGTIKRGKNALEDAENIQLLLDSEKEAAEITMCTDVDRNDKSRICEPGSVEVIGRRQIEMYSKLIHTVDHVKGRLRPGFDAVDAFLTHMWVVTVTGAPKLWAMNFIEEKEKSPRRWYAGAVGWFGFNGDLNTGLVLRTLRIEKGIAEIRVGATLLYDSIPELEEEETRLKASAFIELLKKNPPLPNKDPGYEKIAPGKRILLVDHQDSFVHTLANYFRQTGAELITLRYDKAYDYLRDQDFDLVVLSPGPGCPDDFNIRQTIDLCLGKKIPIFGVCLGLQALVEYFGGDLDKLAYPMHGKSSRMYVQNESRLFQDLGESFLAARYHSLYAKKETFPEDLTIAATSEDGVIMAITHKNLPVYAVQFHPEAILSLTDHAGFQVIVNVMKLISE